MDVINHPDVEAVWICSPSQFHAEQILACADAGKHIFCEKPLATDLKETLDAVNYCRTKGVKLMTALQRRFDPNFVRCKEAVVNGEIGKPIVIKLCSRDPAPPPRSYVEGGGGIFKDMAVHDLDMARFLMGCEPVRVLATGACNVDPTIADLEAPECYDSANIIVKFENGKECIIDVCRKAVYGYDQRAEILCEDGMVMTDNMHPSTVRMFNRDFVGHADKPYDFFMSRYSEAYKAETLAFIECLVEDKPSPCTGRDGIVALVMAMAAGKSAVEERWVDFGEILREEKIIDVSSMLNSEGKLGKNWVRAMMLGLSRDASSIEDMEDLFAISDLDGDGFVNQVEALAILSRMGIEMNVSEMKAMITKADKDGNGKMDLAEFKVHSHEPVIFRVYMAHSMFSPFVTRPFVSPPKAMLFDSGVKLAKNQLFNYVN